MELALGQAVPEHLVFGRALVGGFTEHRMLAPDDLILLVTEGEQEIAVGMQDAAFEIELDHRLCAVDGRHGGHGHFLEIVLGRLHS